MMIIEYDRKDAHTPVSVNKGNFKGVVLPPLLVESTKLKVPILRVGTLKTKGSNPYSTKLIKVPILRVGTLKSKGSTTYQPFQG